jgi:purine-binding chemotaxis protein CheW
MLDNPTTQWLTFNVGKECFAIPITHIRELVTRKAITNALADSDYIEGMMVYRGSALCVMNAAKRLNIATNGSSDLLIVMDSAETQFALAVDKVGEVRSFTQDSHQALFNGTDPAIRGVINADQGLVITIKPECLLQENDRQKKESSHANTLRAS